jgi:hypothetical protein
LFKCVESVKEALQRYNRALSDEGRAISVVGSSLEYTVPVLQTINVLLLRELGGTRKSYDSSYQIHGRVYQSIKDVERKGATLTSAASEKVKEVPRTDYLNARDHWAREDTICEGGTRGDMGW